MASQDQNPRAKLWDMIRDIRFTMLTTRTPGGELQSRPVTTQNKASDEGERLWFFLSAGSRPVADIMTEPHVNLAYAHPGSDRYVSVSGIATVVDDLRLKRELWNKMAEAWFPKGPDDPDLALVEVRITQADYWDVKENKLTQLFKMAKAAATGHPPRDMGERGRVRLH